MIVKYIFSKKHGVKECIVDDDVAEFMDTFGNGSGKWCISVRRGNPYVQKRISNNKVVELHRLILDAPKGTYVDHINHNTLDNRRDNLRICTNAANLRNGSIRVNNKSGFNGVTWLKDRKKWVATIKVNYKTINLGRFDNIKDAIAAREAANIKYWN